MCLASQDSSEAIDCDELARHLLAAESSINGRDLQFLIELFDSNKDGQISFGEMIEVLVRNRHELDATEELAESFALLTATTCGAFVGDSRDKVLTRSMWLYHAVRMYSRVCTLCAQLRAACPVGACLGPRLCVPAVACARPRGRTWARGFQEF